MYSTKKNDPYISITVSSAKTKNIIMLNEFCASSVKYYEIFVHVLAQFFPKENI